LTINCRYLDNVRVARPLGVDTVSLSASAELLQKLSANPWFGALALGDRRAVLTACDRVRLRAGEMLFRLGDADGIAATRKIRNG
jgi:hypothetical protein